MKFRRFFEKIGNFQKSRDFQILAPGAASTRGSCSSSSRGRREAERVGGRSARSGQRSLPRVDSRPANAPGTIRDIRQSNFGKNEISMIFRKKHKFSKNREFSKISRFSDSGSWDGIDPWELLVVGREAAGRPRAARGAAERGPERWQTPWGTQIVRNNHTKHPETFPHHFLRIFVKLGRCRVAGLG